MNLFISLAEKTSETVSYKIGYALGYFAGGHIFEILAVFLVILAAIAYFSFFRKKEKI